MADVNVIAIMAIGMTLVIITGGIDLSVGFVMGLAAVVINREILGLVDRRAGL